MSSLGHIICDLRERVSGVPEMLRQDARLRVEEQTLESGDYLVAGEFGVERKTTADFILSIEDGRLFSQVRRMKAQYPRSALVIEGSAGEGAGLFSVSRMSREAIEGALASLAACWQMPFVCTSGPADTARFLTWSAFQLGRQIAGYYTGDARGRRRTGRLRAQQLRVLRSFPGVGPVLARELLGSLGSVRAFANADIPDLRRIRGIGPRRAAQIYRVLDEPTQPHVLPRGNLPSEGDSRPELASAKSPTIGVCMPVARRH